MTASSAQVTLILIGSLLLTGLLFLPATAFGEEVIDSIAVVIDDEIILESEISYGVSTILLENGIKQPTREQIAEFRRNVFEAYITQKILLAQAIDETLAVEDRVIERELQRKLQALVAQVGSEDQLVAYFDKPMRLIKREMRDGVRDGLLIEMLKQRHITNVFVRRQDVVSFFEKNMELLPVQPAQVELSHLQLEIKPSAAAFAEAKSRITEIEALLEAGADFDSTAKIYSEGPSKVDGGRLGFTNRGDLVPAYEQAAYQLQPGERSGIVESPFGLHLIKLRERQGERISTQHILIQLTPSEEDVNAVLETARALKQRFENGESFAALARQYSIDQETAAQGGKLDAALVENLPAEFQLAIESLAEGQASEPFLTEYGMHLVKLEKFQEEHHLSLAEDWQTIEMYTMANKREVMFRNWVEELKRNHYIWPTQE